jgi:membrane glycosyltransferase
MLTGMLSGVLLLGPKVLGSVLVLSRPGERRAFGGATAVLKGMMMEVFLSMALAPILMVANSGAVMRTLRGQDVGWRPQRREAAGVAWADAMRAMRGQMIAGAAFVGALCVRPDLAICFAPIVLPLLLAAPLVVFTSRAGPGEALARAGVLLTPRDRGVSAKPIVAPAAGRQAQAGGAYARPPLSTLS